MSCKVVERGFPKYLHGYLVPSQDVDKMGLNKVY